MTWKRGLPDRVKLMIMQDREEGLMGKEIAEKHGITLAKVKHVIRRFKYPSSESFLTDLDIKTIKYRRATTGESLAELADCWNVSRTTIRRALSYDDQ